MRRRHPRVGAHGVQYIVRFKNGAPPSDGEWYLACRQEGTGKKKRLGLRATWPLLRQLLVNPVGGPYTKREAARALQRPKLYLARRIRNKLEAAGVDGHTARSLVRKLRKCASVSDFGSLDSYVDEKRVRDALVSGELAAAALLSTDYSTPATTDPMRCRMRQMLLGALKKAAVENQLPLPSLLLGRRAGACEAALFSLLTQKGNSKAYARQYRALKYNLLDEKNNDFREHLVREHLDAERLAHMTSLEMASGEMKAVRKAAKKRAYKQVVVKEPVFKGKNIRSVWDTFGFHRF